MAAFEATKELLLGEMLTSWLSHVVTVLFVSLTSVVIGLLVRRITLRQRQEAETQTANKDLFQTTLLNSLPVAVFYKDRSGAYLGCNQLFTEILGVTAEQIKGRYVHDIWQSDLAMTYHQKDLELMEQGGRQHYQYKVRDKEGRERDVHYSKAVFLDTYGSPAGLVGAFLDVSDKVEAERKLEEYRSHLEILVSRKTGELHRTNTELAHLLSVASHDLQEPLRGILIQLDKLTQETNGVLNTEATQTIQRIRDAAKIMRARISDVYEFLEVIQSELKIDEADSMAIVRSAIERLHPNIDSAGATIDIGPMPLVFADAGRLRDVFISLIENAIKFRHPERPPNITIAAETTDEEWSFSVSDNGIGIEPRYHQMIFGLFRRLHSRGAYPGTGMGLARCRVIVERHGGRIGVGNGNGCGATLFFTLPVTKLVLSRQATQA